MGIRQAWLAAGIAVAAGLAAPPPASAFIWEGWPSNTTSTGGTAVDLPTSGTTTGSTGSGGTDTTTSEPVDGGSASGGSDSGTVVTEPDGTTGNSSDPIVQETVTAGTSDGSSEAVPLSAQQTPEPATLALGLIGAGVAAGWRLRRKS